MARLGTLRELDLNHFHLVKLCGISKFLIRETSIAVAAAKIAGTDLPNRIASELAVIGADAAFSGVMGKAANFCALVQCANGIG